MRKNRGISCCFPTYAPLGDIAPIQHNKRKFKASKSNNWLTPEALSAKRRKLKRAWQRIGSAQSYEVLERLLLSRLKDHILQNMFKFHSISIGHRQYLPQDRYCHARNIERCLHHSGLSTSLVALNQSAAFYTLDHATIIDRLDPSHIWHRIIGHRLAHVISYTNRSQCVKFGDVLSPLTNIVAPRFLKGMSSGQSCSHSSYPRWQALCHLQLWRLVSSICGRHTTWRRPNIHCRITEHPGQMQSCGTSSTGSQTMTWHSTHQSPKFYPRAPERSFIQSGTLPRYQWPDVSTINPYYNIARSEHQKSGSDTGLGTLLVQTCRQHL